MRNEPIRAGLGRARPRIATLLAVCATGLLSSVAQALSCAAPTYTLGEAYHKANSIIIAVVSHCDTPQSTEPWVRGGEGCAFSMLEVLKDATPSRDYSGVVDSSACGLSIVVGQQYLLFLDADNRPLVYSKALPDTQAMNRVLDARVDLLRRYRDGAASELAEPWVANETLIGACTMSQWINRNSLSLTRRPPHAVPLEDIDWENLEAGGRKLIPPDQAAEIRRQVAAMPPPPADPPHILEVSLEERRPNAPRHATLRVGDKRWSLERNEVPLPDMLSAQVLYRYSLSGDAVLEVISALESPADVAVTATLAAPVSPPESPPEATPVTETKNGVVPVAGRNPPGFSGVAPDNSAADIAQQHRPRPQPVLSFETRSTNIGPALAAYRACNAPR